MPFFPSLLKEKKKREREKEREMKSEWGDGETLENIQKKIPALYKITSPGQLGQTRVWRERKKVQFKDKFLFPNFFLNLFCSFVDLILKTIF